MAVAIEAMSMTLERDRRAMNHMDPETRDVHARLEHWADWVRDHPLQAFPPRTMLGRVIEEGLHGAGASGAPPSPEFPPAVALVERAVLALCVIDQRVIRQYYLAWGTAEAHARACRMSVRQFRNVLKRARWRLSGYLAAREI